MGPQCDDDGLVFNLQHLLGLNFLLREEGAWGRRPAVRELGLASSYLEAPTNLPQPRDLVSPRPWLKDTWGLATNLEPAEALSHACLLGKQS